MKAKHYLYGALAAMMLMTSCQDDAALMGNNGDVATVSFNLGTPEIATRAYSDGTTATVLQYAVYDAQGNELTDLTKSLKGNNAETINIRKNVSLQLTTGDTYTVIFWAAAPNAPYDVDFDAKTMTVDYAKAKTLSNDESRDAFYKDTTFTVTGAMEVDIHLRRPFAQLNIGTSDYAAAESSGYEPTKSAVTVENVYNTLNLWNGEVTGETIVMFDYNNIPTGETFPVTGYDYLSMNYLLVPRDKGLVNIVFGYTETDETVAKTRTVGSVPVQRNHRTNIYGQLLTSDVDINVEIIPDYDDPDHDVIINSEAEKLVVTVANDFDLQEAINNATGDMTIRFASDITSVTRAGNVLITVPQKEGVNLTIDGNNFKFDGTFDLYGHARYQGAETLTFTNINFVHTAGSLDFISCNTTESEKRYAHNVAVENCTFTGNDNGDVVAMRYRQCYNMSVKNTTATNMHSLMWATGTTGVTIDGVTIENSKNGISLGTSLNNVVRNSNIAVTDGYGLRADGGVTTTLNVENTTIDSKQPIIVRNVKSGHYTVVLEGNTLTTTEDYQVVLTNGSDDEAYVEPNGKFTIIGATGLNVFPEITPVQSQDELTTALANLPEDGIIYVAEGEYTMPAKDNFTSDVTLVCAEGTVFTGTSKLNINGATIIGATFSNPNGTAVDQTINGIFKDCTFEGSNGLRWSYAGETVVFEDCVFSGSVYGVHFDGGANDVIFRNCEISGFNALGGALTMVTFEGCTFKGNGMSNYNGANLWGNTKMIDCEFTFDGSTATEWIDCISAEKTYEFTNCTVNGEKFDEKNYVVYDELISSRNHAVVKINGVDCQF